MNLCPPGRTRVHCPAVLVERYLLGELFFLFQHKRPRPYEMHIAAQNVIKLREFVHAQTPHPTAYPSEALVHFLRRLYFSVPACIPVSRGLHGTKFIKSENLSALAYAPLTKQDRFSGIEPDRERDQAHQGKRWTQADQRDE